MEPAWRAPTLAVARTGPGVVGVDSSTTGVETSIGLGRGTGVGSGFGSGVGSAGTGGA